MTEMNAVARFFVNTFGARRSARRWRWIRENARLPPGLTCLEIGPGNGAMACRLTEGLRPRRYLAMELHRRQLSAAQRRIRKEFPNGPLDALTFGRANMLHLPIADRSIDATFAFLSIHHASRSHRDFSGVPFALAELDRVLRPGGWLVYEEFVHADKIRRWLESRGYSIEVLERRWIRERVVARKR